MKRLEKIEQLLKKPAFKRGLAGWILITGIGTGVLLPNAAIVRGAETGWSFSRSNSGKAEAAVTPVQETGSPAKVAFVPIPPNVEPYSLPGSQASSRARSRFKAQKPVLMSERPLSEMTSGTAPAAVHPVSALIQEPSILEPSIPDAPPDEISADSVSGSLNGSLNNSAGYNSAGNNSAENTEASTAKNTPFAASGQSASDENLTQGAETLEDIWREAIEVSRKLQSKDYDYAKAEQDVRAAEGVGLPKLANASGRHTVSEQLAIDGNISVMGKSIPYQQKIMDTDFTTSITTLTIPVYMGGRVRGMIQVANAAADAIAAGKQISVLDLKYETAQTYFLVFRVRRLLEVAQEAEKTFARHKQDAERLFANGMVTKNVVLTADVALANARQDVIKAQNAASLSEAALNRLLWRPLNTPVDITDIPVPELSGKLDPLTEEAVHRRPELTALAHKSRALAASAKVKRADRLPQVALVGAHNYIENSNLNEESSFSGSIGMVWMPIDGGVSRAQQQAANYEALSVTKEYEEARNAISLQVYQAWLDESESRGRINVAQKAVDQANENLRVTTRGFQEGVISHTEVLDATALWTQAQSNLANARYDAILSTYGLHRAVGDL